jgi:hypothetical protein
MTINNWPDDLDHVLKIRLLIVLVFYKIHFMKKIIAAGSVIFMLLPFSVSAHPGHGETGGYTITHYFTESVHAVVSFGLLAAIAVYIKITGRNKAHK